MGEAWSCPCGAREQRKLEIKTGNPPARRRKQEPQEPDLTFLRTDHPFKIAFVPTVTLETFFLDVCIPKHLGELYPCFVFQSPLDELTAVVFFLPHGLSGGRCTADLRFKVHPYTFPGSEKEVTAKHLNIAFNAFDREQKLEVIGATAHENGLKVVYGQRSLRKADYSLYVFEYKDPMNPLRICNFLTVQHRQGHSFRFSVTLQSRLFLIFEKEPDDGKDYYGAFLEMPFGLENLRGMPNSVHAQLSAYSFEGAIPQPSANTLLLIFKSLD